MGVTALLLKNPSTGQVLHMSAMKAEVVNQVVDVFRKYDHYFHFYDEDTVYAEKNGPLFEYIVSMSEKFGDRGIKTKLVPDVKSLIGHSVNVLKMGFNLIDEEISLRLQKRLRL